MGRLLPAIFGTFHLRRSSGTSLRIVIPDNIYRENKVNSKIMDPVSSSLVLVEANVWLGRPEGF